MNEISKEFWISIAAAAMLFALMIAGGTHISRIGSLLMLAAFAAYMVFLILKAMRNKTAENPDTEPGKEQDAGAKKPRSLPVQIIFAILGCVLIVGGGTLTVDNATLIAQSLGITDRMIGLTIIAMGTSLPELITSLVACRKGENEFALANIVGSNTFNIMFILGIAGVISPLEIDPALIFDTIYLITGSTVALIFVYTSNKLLRWEGVVMVLMYLVYMSILIFQQ